MSDPEASLIESKRIDGTLDKNNDFETTDGKIWRQKSKPLGEGGYSQVYLYKEDSGSKVAVKKIPNISAGGRTTSAELEKEKAALIKFSHQERFIDFIGWFANENTEYFALEYMRFGSLEDSLKKRRKAKRPLSEEEIKRVLTQILEGVEIMHAEGYIHRDLKPENILVAQKGPEWQVKITDLGLSKCTLGVREGYSFTGTPQYMAPEIYGSFLRPSDYTDAIDIWAVGCIACRMLIGEPPFSDPWLLVQYLEAIKASKPLDQLCKEVPYISKDLAGLLDTKTSKGLFVRQLLEPKPEKRLNASHAKGHPWLQRHGFWPLQGHENSVTQVVFSPNGELLASASLDRTIRLWSVEERKAKHILDSPGSKDHIAFWLDKTLVALEIGEGLVRVWDTGTGEEKKKLEFPMVKRNLSAMLVCSPDGSLVASAQSHNTPLQLWNTETGEETHMVEIGLFPSLPRIYFSSNGELMALLSPQGSVRLINTREKIEEPIFTGGPQIAANVTLSPNGQFMALEGEGAIWLWDKEEKEAKRIFKTFKYLDGPFFSPNSNRVAWAWPDDFAISLVNTLRKRETHKLEGHLGRVTRMAFSPISPLLASASRDHTVILWDTEKGEKLCTLIAHSDIVKDVAFSPNGDLVATASADGIVGLWNVSQWKNRKDQE